MPEDTLLFFVNECGIWPEEDPSKNEELVEVAVEVSWTFLGPCTVDGSSR